MAMKTRVACVLISFGAVACSTGPSDSKDGAKGAAFTGECPAVGSKNCPNDSPIEQKKYDSCVAIRADPRCGKEATEVIRCALAVPCSAAGTSQLSPECKAPNQALADCLYNDAGP
jgi:hypothetical protein